MTQEDLGKPARAAADIMPINTWLTKFDQNPTGQLSALLGGYAEISPLEHLEPSTILIEQFADLSHDDPLRGKLDDAVVDITTRFRNATSEQIEQHGRALFIHQISEMFIAAGRLRLPKVLTTVANNFQDWSEWAEPLRIADYRDARLSLWRMLSGNEHYAENPTIITDCWDKVVQDYQSGTLSRAYLVVAPKKFLDEILGQLPFQ